MYSWSRGVITNRAYAILKKHSVVRRSTRAAFRKEMKSEFSIKAIDADKLHSDFITGKIRPNFRSKFGATMKLTIYCCKDGEVVYEPMHKDFSIKSIGAGDFITKGEWRKAVMNEIIPRFVEAEGNRKCKNMSESLEVCGNYIVENARFTRRGIPLKVDE